MEECLEEIALRNWMATAYDPKWKALALPKARIGRLRFFLRGITIFNMESIDFTKLPNWKKRLWLRAHLELKPVIRRIVNTYKASFRLIKRVCRAKRDSRGSRYSITREPLLAASGFSPSRSKKFFFIFIFRDPQCVENRDWFSASSFRNYAWFNS